MISPPRRTSKEDRTKQLTYPPSFEIVSETVSFALLITGEALDRSTPERAVVVAMRSKGRIVEELEVGGEQREERKRTVFYYALTRRCSERVDVGRCMILISWSSLGSSSIGKQNPKRKLVQHDSRSKRTRDLLTRL